MCGIVGIIDKKGRAIDPSLIGSMTQAMAHRGPDGSGIYFKENVAIGHRRLSIIDPALGKQPMFNESGTLALTFNGEIYNFKDLRRELRAAGHAFKTQSDTEVVLRSYEEWGKSCVERFRGMFAFGILDFRSREVFIARDQFGIKPLVYVNTNEWFGFASELQGLTANKEIDLTLNLGAIDQYLWLQYIPAPLTAFENFFKLPPGHRLVVSFDGQIKELDEYYKLSFSPLRNRTAEELIEAIDEVIEDSVRAHLVSDVPFGCFLSGGVDSSLVLAYMTKILNRPVKVFSIDFVDDQTSELSYAKEAAKRYGAEHFIDVVSPDALAVLPELVRHYGEPFGDSSAVPTYFVSKMARQEVPMVLSGDGADEFFGGYASYYDFVSRMLEPYDLIQGTMTPPLSTEDFRVERAFEDLSQWSIFINYLGLEDRLLLWRPELRSVAPYRSEIFDRAFERSRKFSTMHRVQYLDTQTYLPYDILTKVDVASMIHGLEVRTPLIDRFVADIATKIPERFTFGFDASVEYESKRLLKRVAERYYPTEFIRRPKRGFSMPTAHWFSPGSKAHSLIEELLFRPDSYVREFFDINALRVLFDQQRAGQIWLFLFFEVWKDSLSSSTQILSENVEIMSPN